MISHFTVDCQPIFSKLFSILARLKKSKVFLIFFKKGIDKHIRLWYNLYRCDGVTEFNAGVAQWQSS